MIRFAALLIAGLLLIQPISADSPVTNAAPAAPHVPGAWDIESAPARYVIGPDGNNPPAPVTWVALCPPNPHWDGAPLRVFTDAGEAVGSELLWSAPGEPLTLLFDSSSTAKSYLVYLGSDWPPLALKDDRAGVILETRPGDGTVINNLPDMLTAWNKAPPVIGRAALPSLFEGGNRFGPQSSLLLHFRGWFQGTANEHLELALISTDASFVLIDGKEVVEWPGHHHFGDGMDGRFHGAVDLGVGLHTLDYYNAYLHKEDWPLLCCLAAKGGPLAQWTMLMPATPFFVPLAHAHIDNYDMPGTNAPPFAIDWEPKAQSIIAPEITDIGLITLQFVCRPGPKGTATWTFDDGTTAQGQIVQHLFPRPGMRTVRLEVKDDSGAVKSENQVVSVHPNWNEHGQPDLADEAQKDVLGRAPAVFSASDLASCTAVLATFKSVDAVIHFVPAICAKMKDIADADLPYIKEAALLIAPNLVHAGAADQLLRALIDRSAAPALAGVADPARLALAQLTLLTTDHTAEVSSLLAAIKMPSLSGDEHRSFDLLKADLALATGDLAEARKEDQALTGEPGGVDARSSIRQTGEIGRARAFLAKKDNEAAEESLNKVAREAPIEKLAPDWALLRLRLYQEENLPNVAFIYAKRLLPLITGGGRSELLYRLTTLAQQQGDHTAASQALAELLQKHAYSDEAAQAKAKWPGGV